MRYGNMLHKQRKPSPIQSKAFTKFFISHSFTCSGGRSILLGFTKGVFLTFMFSGNKVFSGWPVLHSVMIFSCSTVPQLQKQHVYSLIKSQITLRFPHTCQQCYLQLIAFSKRDILSYDSFLATEWAKGTNGFTFPLCNKTAFTLSFDTSIRSIHSSGLCGNPSPPSRPFTSLQRQRESCILWHPENFSCLILNRDILISLASEFHCSSLGPTSYAFCLER